MINNFGIMYVLSKNGDIKFTTARKQYLAPMLQLVNLKLDDIKTLTDYYNLLDKHTKMLIGEEEFNKLKALTAKGLKGEELLEAIFDMD